MNAIATVSATSKPILSRFQDIPRPHGPYIGHGEDYVARFYRLVRRWRAETAHLSSLDATFQHPAYIEIVSMGQKVVPLIISEINSQPDWLFGALTEITGEDPVMDHDRGDLDAMILSWTRWASKRG